MRVIYLLLILSVSAGCAADKVGVVKSTVDNSVEVTMNPVPVIPNLLFSLYWNREMGPDKIILKVTKSFGDNLPGGDALHFNVDGEQSDFSSVDMTPEIGYDPGRRNSFATFSGHVWSSRRYLVSTVFVRKLIQSQKTIVSIETAKTKMEGQLSDASSSFRANASDFVQALDRNYQPAR